MPEDRPSRITFLRSRVETAKRSEPVATFDVPFRGSKITLTQVRIRTDFPLYRIQSGRTHRAQARYLDRHPELPTDFFTDPEDPAVQSAQHEIVLDLITEQGLDRDLAARGQWSPLILTYDGFVVDGNRRLCALREESVEYLQAVVLPEDAEASEIYETEVELQMAAETKAPYNWIDEALHIRYGIENLGERPDALAERMRMDVDAVNGAIAQLAVVDMYLDWLGRPGKYHVVPAERGGATQQAFRDLTQALSKQTMQRLSRDEQRGIRGACFAAILSGGGYKDVRDIVKFLRSRSRDFLNRVAETLPDDISLPGRVIDATEVDDAQRSQPSAGDLISELAQSEATPANATLTELLSIVENSQTGLRAGPSIIHAAEDLAAEEKDAQRLVQPLQRVQKALSELRSTELTPDTPGLDEIASVLAELIEAAEQLATRLGQLHPTSS